MISRFVFFYRKRFLHLKNRQWKSCVVKSGAGVRGLFRYLRCLHQIKAIWYTRLCLLWRTGTDLLITGVVVKPFHSQFPWPCFLIPCAISRDTWLWSFVIWEVLSLFSVRETGQGILRKLLFVVGSEFFSKFRSLVSPGSETCFVFKHIALLTI